MDKQIVVYPYNGILLRNTNKLLLIPLIQVNLKIIFLNKDKNQYIFHNSTYINFQKNKHFIVAQRSSVVSQEQKVGEGGQVQEKPEIKILKSRDNFGSNRYFLSFNCDDGFMMQTFVKIYQILHFKCCLLYVIYTSIKLLRKLCQLTQYLVHQQLNPFYGLLP